MYKHGIGWVATIQECPICRTAFTDHIIKKKPDFEINEVVLAEHETKENGLPSLVYKTGTITGYDMNSNTYSIRFQDEKEDVSG